MNRYEANIKVGPNGTVLLNELPFPAGAGIHVSIEATDQRPARKPFKFGLHEGLVEIAADFDDPLPDSFWF